MRGATGRGLRDSSATTTPTSLRMVTSQFITEIAAASSAYLPVLNWLVSSNQTLIAANPAHHRATMSPTATTNRLGGVIGLGPAGELAPLVDLRLIVMVAPLGRRESGFWNASSRRAVRSVVAARRAPVPRHL